MSRTRLPRARQLPGDSGVLSRVVAGLVAAILVLPVVVVAAMSINQTSYLDFPPSGLSGRWFEQLLGDPTWQRAFWQSIVVGVFASMLAATLATCAAIGVRDSRRRRLLEAVFLLPLIVPAIVVALMLYPLYADIGLLGTTPGLVLAHALLAFPYAFLVISGAVHAIDRRLERAAESLGCTRWQTLRMVVVPLLMPAILAGGLVSLVVSFDEVVVSLFLSSPQTRTVPVVMWSFVREEINPTVAAASTLIMLANVVVMLGAGLLARRAVRRRVAAVSAADAR